MFVALGLGAALLLFLVVGVAFPPHGARRWRHLTRPLRRRLRPRHYRGW